MLAPHPIQTVRDILVATSWEWGLRLIVHVGTLIADEIWRKKSWKLRSVWPGENWSTKSSSVGKSGVQVIRYTVVIMVRSIGRISRIVSCVDVWPIVYTGLIFGPNSAAPVSTHSIGKGPAIYSLATMLVHRSSSRKERHQQCDSNQSSRAPRTAGQIFPFLYSGALHTHFFLFNSRFYAVKDDHSRS